MPAVSRASSTWPRTWDNRESIPSARLKSSGLSASDIFRTSRATISSGLREPVFCPRETPIPSAITRSMVTARRSRSAATCASSTTMSVMKPRVAAFSVTDSTCPSLSSPILLTRKRRARSERLNSESAATTTPTWPTTTLAPLMPRPSRPSIAMAIISPSAEGGRGPINSAPSWVNCRVLLPSSSS